MSKDALDGWRVDGKITATEQATQPGDVPILDSTGKIPDELINAVEVDDFYTESTDDDAVTMDENKVWRLNGWEGLEERVGDAEDDIDGLSTRMGTAETGIGALGTRMSTAETGIGTNASAISGLGTRMGTAEGNISGLETDLTTLDGSVPKLTDGKVDMSVLPELTKTLPFTVKASDWTGDNAPFTATVKVTGISSIATPVVGPDSPNKIVQRILSDGDVTVDSVDASDNVTLSAHGLIPTESVDFIASGTVGTRTGKVISAITGDGRGYRIIVRMKGNSGAGVLVTATPALGQTVTGTTDGTGVARLDVYGDTPYTVTFFKDGTTFQPSPTVSVSTEGPLTEIIVYAWGGFYHNISFNGTTFASDPTGCLAYVGELAGAMPVRNASSVLARATQYGSWTPATNSLIAQCCYSTFDEDGD